MIVKEKELIYNINNF